MPTDPKNWELGMPETVLHHGVPISGPGCTENPNSIPDTGSRRTAPTGSVRDQSEGKGRWDLLPYFGLLRWALRMEKGVPKYGERNWEKGQPASWYADSAMRHLVKHVAGMTDEDHLGAAQWNVGALAELEARCARGDLPVELLDLPVHTPEYVADLKVGVGTP
jgi:hypothetical protein